MKRLLQTVSLFALCAMIVFCSSGCYKDYMGKRPCDQPNTAWKSEDGDILFYIGDGWGMGIAYIDGEEKEFRICIGPAQGIDLYFGSGYNDEHWWGTFKESDSFDAEISEKNYGYTKYFELGRTFKFYRVDTSEDEEVFSYLRYRTEHYYDKRLS